MLKALNPPAEPLGFPPIMALHREELQPLQRALPRRTGAASRGLDPGGAEALDLIFVEGLTGETIIGIDENELHETQPLVIDVCAGVPPTRASSTDCIGDTLNYGDLRLRLLRLLDEHRVQLVEAFAELVADIVLYEYQAHWVRVRVAKPRKFANVQALGVIIERRRSVAPVPLKVPWPTA